MSSPPPTTNGVSETASDVESIPADDNSATPLQDVNPVAPEQLTILDKARQRLDDKCTPDEDLRDSLGKLIELCHTLVRAIPLLLRSLLTTAHRQPGWRPSNPNWSTSKQH
jgi:hypothetical protein